MGRLPALILVAALATCSPARAARLHVDYALDGTLTALAAVGGALFALVPVERGPLWRLQLLPVDEGVKTSFSTGAAATSDALLITAVVSPLAAQLGFGMNERLGRVGLAYAETLGASFLLNSAAKYLVQRPRPYTYNPSPEARRYEEEEAGDSRLSFYSGHASTAFAAAVAGSYLFALGAEDTRVRAVLWGAELALATATANLRVRAGRHFYSDVAVGAVVGAGLGALIPYLHQGSPGYQPSALEWGAMAGGVLLGALASELLPAGRTLSRRLGEPGAGATVSLAPMALDTGGGLVLAGAW